jgi:hypothetical protein
MSLLLFFDHPYPAYAPVISTQTLQLPVDYVMADEDDPRNKRPATLKVHPKIMKLIFRE